mmetsp:Transcript_10762/g.25564  ORF Transcript_10762/g.25564 Transcript_10762/m.25564 type:complete len:216 (+) Transcript_10762:1272-1919(+)
MGGRQRRAARGRLPRRAAQPRPRRRAGDRVLVCARRGARKGGTGEGQRGAARLRPQAVHPLGGHPRAQPHGLHPQHDLPPVPRERAVRLLPRSHQADVAADREAPPDPPGPHGRADRHDCNNGPRAGVRGRGPLPPPGARGSLHGEQDPPRASLPGPRRLRAEEGHPQGGVCDAGARMPASRTPPPLPLLPLRPRNRLPPLRTPPPLCPGTSIRA